MLLMDWYHGKCASLSRKYLPLSLSPILHYLVLFQAFLHQKQPYQTVLLPLLLAYLFNSYSNKLGKYNVNCGINATSNNTVTVTNRNGSNSLVAVPMDTFPIRSEERRVGKESTSCRCK